ncbi:MAG: hypothetical protein FWB80_09515 [Defluviitaleaceae bacterium]|nr:hypothetical protein [Defluviitaleaceae bacterium]
MTNKYKLITDTDETMKLRRFEWTIDKKNNAVLSWDWPQNRTIKLMFIFEFETEDAPQIEDLIAKSDRHEVVTRDLANSYTAPIISGKKKYIVVPAFFNEDKGITIVKPAYVTDWLFKKVALNASVSYKPIPLGNFQKATLRVTASDASQMPLVCQILKYAIYEQGRKVGEYPLDTLAMSGACSVIMEKNRIVKYILDENYSHLFNIV